MRGKAMIKASVIAAAVVLGAASLPAQAATWTFSSFTQGGTNANNFGNSYSATDSGVTLTVKAFSSNGAGSTFTAANIGNFGSGSGFGVRNTTETLSATSPNHAMDNNTGTDMLLLNFTQSMTIDSLTTGWHSTDSDISLLRWTGAGGPTITGGTIATLLAAGWSLVNNYANMVDDTARLTNATGSSQYWIISAYNSAWGTGSTTSGLDNGDDYVKMLAAISSSRPPNEVPEPGSMALLALGVAGLAIMRRRSKS